MERRDVSEFDKEAIDKEFERNEKFCDGLAEVLRLNKELKENIEKSIERLKANKPPKWN